MLESISDIDMKEQNPQECIERFRQALTTCVRKINSGEQQPKPESNPWKPICNLAKSVFRQKSLKK